MTLETCRTVPHSKLETTQPSPLDFLSGAVASVRIFPLPGKKEVETATGPVPGAGPWVGQSAATFVGLCVFWCSVLTLCLGGMGRLGRNMSLWTAWGGVRAGGE